ncbi:MAG: hypothetical protein ACSHWQ_06670 [Spongiibacteraceae bacterium]
MTDNAPAPVSRRQVYIILFIPVAVIVFSSLFFFMAQKNIFNLGTVNRGVLIQPPVALPELSLQQNGGEEFLFDTPTSTWLYVVVGGSECIDACERMLYLSRQTHIALGKKTKRVKRVYLSVDGVLSPALRDFIEAEHSDITVLSVDRNKYMSALSQYNFDPLDAQAFYVVDPLGWMMMYYRAADLEVDTLNTLGKDVLKDMRRLLK